MPYHFDLAHLQIYQGAPVVGSPYVAQLKIIPRNDLGEYS
jgi:hypothetical protein